MIEAIVCGVFAFLIAFVLVTRMIMGDDSETRALKARLTFYGIEPKRFSTTCLTDLIEVATRDLRPSKAPTDTAFHEAIDTVAVSVRDIALGLKFSSPADLEADRAAGRTNPFWDILVRHDPTRFGLDHLAGTQALNQLLQADRADGVGARRRS